MRLIMRVSLFSDPPGTYYFPLQMVDNLVKQAVYNTCVTITYMLQSFPVSLRTLYVYKPQQNLGRGLLQRKTN